MGKINYSISALLLFSSLFVAGQTVLAAGKPLDEERLIANSIARIQGTIKKQNPVVTAEELATINKDNVKVIKKIPVSFKNEDYYLVTLQFEGLPGQNAPGQGNAIKPIETTLTVDASGTYQYADITSIADSKSVFSDARREMGKVVVPSSIGSVIFKGKGSNLVHYVSDPFCPYCKKEYAWLKENSNTISELKLVHMPIASLHPTAPFASAVMAYAKDTLPQTEYQKVVDFAYLELDETMQGQPTVAALNAAEQKLFAEFTKKFPDLIKNKNADEAYYLIKGKYVPIVEEEGRNAGALFKVSGTPNTFVNGAPVRGFNESELKQLLR